MTAQSVASFTFIFRLSGRVATDIVFSNAILAISLWTIKKWLLSQNVGAFWVLMRILACGALGLGLREVTSGNAPKALVAASSAKVRTSFLFSSVVFVSPMCAVRSRHMIFRRTVDFTSHGLRGLLFSTR
jgi:hypothetical protein